MRKQDLFIRYALIAFAVSVLAPAANGQSAQDCMALMKFGVYDKF